MSRLPDKSRETAPDANAGQVRTVFETVAARYDLMNDLMSGGLHRLWKEALIARLGAIPRGRGFRILDMACGTGDIGRRILARHADRPRLRVIGADATAAMLAHMPRQPRMPAICLQAETLPFADCSFDAYTISFGIRNASNRGCALAEAFRVLKPGGRFVCLEFAPALPRFQRLYDAWSEIAIPALGRWVVGDERPYRYLVDSIRRFDSGEVFAARLEAAGFARIDMQPMTGGVVALHSGWRL